MVNAQDCYSSHLKTVALGYTYHPSKDGINLEYGYMANEKRTNILVGSAVWMHKPKVVSGKQDYIEYDNLEFDQYLKFSYRVLRIPYTLSISTGIIGGYSFDTGPYGGISTRFLVPMNTKALSIEPALTTRGFTLQGMLIFMIN